MRSPKRNNVKLLVAVIGGSGVVGDRARCRWPIAQEQAGRCRSGQVSGKSTVGRDKHRDDADDGGGHDDGGAGDEGPGAAAHRRTGARRAVANSHRFHG